MLRVKVNSKHLSKCRVFKNVHIQIYNSYSWFINEFDRCFATKFLDNCGLPCCNNYSYLIFKTLRIAGNVAGEISMLLFLSKNKNHNQIISENIKHCWLNWCRLHTT